MLYYCSLRGL